MIEKFKDENILLINEWLIQRSLPKTIRQELPEIGFVYRLDYPIAAMFLRRCEGHIGILDSLITNATALASERHLAIEALVSHLTEYAKKHCHFNRLIVFSKDQGIIERAAQQSFGLISEHVYSKSI